MTGSTPAPSIRRLLVPCDLSPESARALGHARLLAWRFNAHTTLYHALEIPADRWMRAAGREEELRTSMAAEARAELERLAASLEGPHDVVVEGDVSAARCLADIAVLRQVNALRPDVVVMATHSRGALGSFFLGSVAQEVLRSGGRPVLAVPPAALAPADGYRRIVLATDLSEPSRRAFPLAALLALRFDAAVFVVYVVPRPLLTALGDNPYALSAAVPGTEALRAFAEEMADCRLTPRVEQGAPWERIVAVARQEKADLIVMATDGADSLGERLLGSQTERVIRHAPCAVLAV